MFLYKYKLLIKDKDALRLKLTIENPFLVVIQLENGKVFLKNSKNIPKKAKFVYPCIVKMTKKHWEAEVHLPFVWEKHYRWKYVNQYTYQLSNKGGEINVNT